MSAETEKYVRLNRTPFSGRWEAVRLASDGRTIVQRWPLHPDDAATLEAITTTAKTSDAKEARVHNHAPYRPACNERDNNGQLRGACLNDDGSDR